MGSCIEHKTFTLGKGIKLCLSKLWNILLNKVKKEEDVYLSKIVFVR